MNDRAASAGPVLLGQDSHVAYRPSTRGLISAGIWADRRRINREVSVPEA